MTPEQIESLTDAEIAALISAASSEVERRRAGAAIPGQVEVLNREYLAISGVISGGEWRQPLGAHDAYPSGWVVEHSGKTWLSLTPGNVWEPGVSGWREQVAAPNPGEDGETPETPAPTWIQPTGAHDSYNEGDKVTFNGAAYQSLINANTWSPADYPAGWQKL